MVEEIKRQTAYKCTIETINRGVFVKKTGWESSYTMTEYGDFSRVNVIAVVISKEDNGITIDDNTGQISGRFFDNPQRLDGINVGDVVLVIGKPRDFNERIYLTLEIVKRIGPDWIAYRNKELKLIQKIRDPISPAPAKKQEPEIVESGSILGIKDRIAKTIMDLDKGSGASIEDVLKMARAPNAEEIISDMMMRGEIYENKAGHVKLM